ncbi:MAG: asparagine synthase-related protein [bacterium]
MPNILNDWQTAVTQEVISAANPNWNEPELEKILKAAIKTCAEWCMSCNKDGWIFMTLSGGLDSSFCLAIIRQLFPKAVISTYTIGGNKEHPDIMYARTISKIFGANHVEIVPTGYDKNNEEIYWKKAFQNAFPKVQTPTGGDIAVFTVYRTMALNGANAVIAHDGIDELLGGYWPHRGNVGLNQEEAFRDFWRQLVPKHLKPLQRDADHFKIKLLLPYLQLPAVKYIAGIPVHERTSHEESKIPLRNIARKYLLLEIIERKKVGFCSGLDKF